MCSTFLSNILCCVSLRLRIARDHLDIDSLTGFCLWRKAAGRSPTPFRPWCGCIYCDRNSPSTCLSLPLLFLACDTQVSPQLLYPRPLCSSIFIFYFWNICEAQCLFFVFAVVVGVIVTSTSGVLRLRCGLSFGSLIIHLIVGMALLCGCREEFVFVTA